MIVEPQQPDTTPRRWSETTPEFLRRSTMPYAVEARARLRSWLALLSSEKERARIVADVTSCDSRRHRAAVWELGLLKALDDLGYEVVPHPSIPDRTTTPDWLAVGKFYLEATLVADSDERVGEAKRIGELLDALEEISSPHFMFEVTVDKIGRSTPARSKFKEFIRSRLAHLDYESEAVADKRWCRRQ